MAIFKHLKVALFAMCISSLMGKLLTREHAYGGHFNWKAGNQDGEVLVDYTLFFSRTGEIGRQCTEQAIRENRVIKTAIPILLWKSDPDRSAETPVEIGQAEFRCIMRGDDVTETSVVKRNDFKYKHDNLKKYYIGITNTKRMTPLYTYVDLTPRKDTGTINRSPEITMFPYYQADSDGDTRIVVHAVDRDNDYIKCTSLVTKSILRNCELVVPASVPNKFYTAGILVEDYRNKYERESFSKAVVHVTVNKIEARPTRLRPTINIYSPRKCEYALPFGTWSKSLYVNYRADHDINDLIFLGPDNMQIQTQIVPRRMRIAVTWTPQEAVEGRYLFCFFITSTQRVTRTVYAAEPKCWYLNVGKEPQFTEIEYLYPKHRGSVEQPLTKIELKVKGAYQMPVVPTNLYIFDKKTNKVQHEITLKRPQTYKIEDDNRLVINIPEPKIMPAGEYFINTDKRLFVSQDICLKGKGIFGRDEWNFIAKDPSESPRPTPGLSMTQQKDMDGSLTLERGRLFEIIPVWPKLWRISFKIKPSKEALQQRSNIFQFTTGESCCDHGFAIPGVWIEENTRSLYMVTSINDNGNQVFVTDNRFIKLPSDRFTEVIIQQVEGYRPGQYVFRVQVNNLLATIMVNRKAREYKNVKVFTSSPDWQTANVEIKDFDFEPRGYKPTGSPMTTTDMPTSTSTSTEYSFNNQQSTTTEQQESTTTMSPGEDSTTTGSAVSTTETMTQHEDSTTTFSSQGERQDTTTQQPMTSTEEMQSTTEFDNRSIIKDRKDHVTATAQQEEPITHQMTSSDESTTTTEQVMTITDRPNVNDLREPITEESTTTTTEQPTTATTRLAGKNCWAGCGAKGGACPQWCGKDGFCCRQGWVNKGCENALSACNGFHCCTAVKENVNKPKQNRPIELIKNWGRTWRLSFNVKPLSSTRSSKLKSIIHFTTESERLRIPAVWFDRNSRKVLVVYNYLYFTTPEELPTDRYTSIKLKLSKSENGEDLYQAFVNNKKVYERSGSFSKEYKNVRVYLSSPWYGSADALVKDLEYQSPLNAVNKGKNLSNNDRHSNNNMNNDMNNNDRHSSNNMNNNNRQSNNNDRHSNNNMNNKVRQSDNNMNNNDRQSNNNDRQSNNNMNNNDRQSNNNMNNNDRQSSNNMNNNDRQSNNNDRQSNNNDRHSSNNMNNNDRQSNNNDRQSNNNMNNNDRQSINNDRHSNNNMNNNDRHSSNNMNKNDRQSNNNDRQSNNNMNNNDRHSSNNMNNNDRQSNNHMNNNDRQSNNNDRQSNNNMNNNNRHSSNNMNNNDRHSSNNMNNNDRQSNNNMNNNDRQSNNNNRQSNNNMNKNDR
uniref:Uncharacterized protein n=1 Tax=Clytia hemisphaerica TaxID=252671 RepID=A0A7M5WQS8_9CNID